MSTTNAPTLEKLIEYIGDRVLVQDFHVQSGFTGGDNIPERDRLRGILSVLRAHATLQARVETLENLVQRYASECGECGGKGWHYVGEGVSGRGPDDIEPEQVHCAECADIRAALNATPSREGV